MERKNTLLQAKIQAPSTAPSYIVRERLLQRLEDARERLIAVSASMGYGKTVLLTHYAKRYPQHCAWYHLSELDNDIMVFANYLCWSVRRVAPDFQMDLSPYVALEQNENMVDNLAYDFLQGFRQLGEERFTVVLDDFQVIENEWIFRFIQLLIGGDTGGLRMILCMKTSPPAFCARWLMEGKALILGADLLAFQMEEIKFLLKDQCAPAALDAAAQAMLDRTEGWPAGISFVLLYFKQWRREMTEQEIDRACRQNYLRDYFIHEMFRKLPFELQQFLICTSVLDYLRPDVCNVLMDIENSDSQLAYLEQENLFILHLSGEGQIYRYHQLFRNFLMSQLKPGQRKALLGKAADFYLRTPDKTQAAEYAIACRDGERLLSAVEAAGMQEMMRGRLDTIRRWFDALDDLDVVLTPDLMVLRAFYDERVGEWKLGRDLVRKVLSMPQDQVGTRCRMKAGVLLAWLHREWGSVQDSLKALEEYIPAKRSGRRKLDDIRWWGVELRFYDYLILGRYDRALSLVLDEMDDCARHRNQTEMQKARELAVVCYAEMGEYRQAMQMYVVLRGSGADSTVASPCIDLYHAVSGRGEQALRHLNQCQAQYENTLIRYKLEQMVLIYMLVERMVILDSGEDRSDSEFKRLWDNAELIGGGATAEETEILQRVYQGGVLSQEEEDMLFGDGGTRFGMLVDAGRWLKVRETVLKGDRTRALEMCALAAKNTRNAQDELGEDYIPTNAFIAFMAIEEALLLSGEDPERAASIMERWTAYLNENQLWCPGLTEQEREMLKALQPDGNGQRQTETKQQEEVEQVSGNKVSVQCFGPFRVTLPDGQELNWRTRKAQELFAYLFHLQGDFADRERLLDTLWPQSAPTNATSLLHTTLYSIRKGLAPYGLDGIICREKRGYRMDMSLVESPREKLDALCEGEDYDPEELPDIYRGAYLEDVEGSWCADSRAWYSGAFLRVCRSVSQRSMEQGNYTLAAGLLRSAVRQEPYDEELAGQLIRCYAALGETKNAIQVYRTLEDTLNRDLEEKPGEEITKIYKECLLRRLGRGRSQ